MFDVNGVSFKTRFLTLFASATLLVAFVPTVGMSPVSAAPVLAEANVLLSMCVLMWTGL